MSVKMRTAVRFLSWSQGPFALHSWSIVSVSVTFSSLATCVWMFILCSRCSGSMIFVSYFVWNAWTCPLCVATVTSITVGAAWDFCLSFKAWHGWIQTATQQCRCCVSCTHVCLFLDLLLLERKQEKKEMEQPFPSPSVLSLTPLIGPHTLWVSSCFPALSLLCSVSTLWLCWQTGRSRLTYCTGFWKKAPQAKSEQNGKHRWPLTRTRVHGKQESTFSSFAGCLIHLSSCFCSAKLCPHVRSLTLAPGFQSGLISFELHCV